MAIIVWESGASSMAKVCDIGRNECCISPSGAQSPEYWRKRYQQRVLVAVGASDISCVIVEASSVVLPM